MASACGVLYAARMTERPGDPGVPAGASAGGSVGPPSPTAEQLAAVRLREALASGSARTRAESIARTGPGPGVEALLVSSLEDPEPIVRTAAVRALARLSGIRSASALIRVSSSDPSPEVRLEAVAAIGRLLEGRLRVTDAESTPQ
jgi:HEAT repeat protein